MCSWNASEAKSELPSKAEEILGYTIDSVRIDISPQQRHTVASDSLQDYSGEQIPILEGSPTWV